MDLEGVKKNKIEAPVEEAKISFRETFDENYEGLVRHRAEFVLQELNGRVPSQVELILLSEKYGDDVSSHVYYQSLVRSKKYYDFIKAVDNETKSFVKDPGYKVVLCDGDYPFIQDIKYKENFLKYKIEDAGYEVEHIQYKNNLTIMQNAEILFNSLMDETDKPVLLITFGVGGAIANLLNSHPNYHKSLGHVKVWINISGAVKGLQILKDKFSSPLKTAVFSLWSKIINYKVNLKGLQQLSLDFPAWGMDPSLSVWKPQVISIVGIPLKKHVPAELKSNFNQLSDFGPNDGVNVISDITTKSGFIYPVWGGSFLMNRSFFEYRFRKILCFIARGVKF